MTLSDLSIRRPVFAWMLMVALILFGAIGFSRMGISEMPDVDFPVIAVHLSLEGAAPEIMETDVADVVEEALTTLEGIREINTSCRQGEAVLTVEFELERDIDAALQEVQTKISQSQSRLPNDMEPPVVTKTNPEDQPILWIGLSGDRPVRELMTYTQNYLKDQLQTVSGVGEVFLGGFLEPNLRIWIDPKKLFAYELTVEDVITAIEREHVEMPAGRIETSEKEFNVRAMGEVTTPEDFGKILILRRGGQPIYKPISLREIAEVELGMSDFRRISRVNGKMAIGLGVRKQRGANAVAVARNVRQKVEALRSDLPSGLEIGINFDSTRFIEESVRELNFTLILSAILTGLVCWAFLGSFTSTLNIWLAIPTSIVGTFLVLYFAGFTLNNFTVLGLILAVGIVVDDAIMVLENIVRHQEMGENRVTAALKGARQITFAAVAATLAVVAIFLPVAFMSGIIGKFFFQFGVTMSVAVLLSLLEALTLTPMRASQFVSVGKRRSRLGQKMDRLFDKLSEGYEKSLSLALKHRWKVIFFSVTLFAASLACLFFLRKEFVPSQDQSMILVRLQTPAGSSLAFTDNRFRQAESLVKDRPEVNRYFAAVGGFGGGEVNTGMLFVTLQPKKERKLSQQEFMDMIRKELAQIPDTKAFVQDLSTRGFTARRGFPVEFTIRGPDWEKIVEYSQAIQGKMEADSIFLDIDTDYQTDMPEIQVRPHREEAARRGVSVETIAQVINAAVGGIRVGKFTEGGRRNDIRVQLKAEERIRAEQIQALHVRNNLGELVPLSEVTTLTEKPTLLTITRRDRERAVQIFSNIATGGSQTEALRKVKDMGKEILPEGYRLVFSGSAQTFQESFHGLIFALWLGIIVSYMILASQFNSFLHPFTILLALPFSLSGALIGLWVFGSSLNLYSMIGLILLMGIVKKNSILLVDFTNQMRQEGMPVTAALEKACPIRLRPILMTSLSTVAAAIPAAIGFGPGAEVRAPMAIAVIGGVLLSTLLTLYVVPAAYSLLSRFERQKPV
ncbi:MAG: efflux RND transporter permease subunit [Deltaproteobacteria bacterium]|nr:efflux RND transporter permease subunit [Deltaproteobacteria bacterium]